MGKTAINLTIVLGLIILAFSGYYLFVKGGDSPLSSFFTRELVPEEVVQNVENFVQYRETLSKIELDSKLKVLSDVRFSGLRSYATPVIERPVGRDNPFMSIGNNVQNQ